ncbi:MAG TPA: carbamoyltransferase HypF [Acidimicrobiia bacterium]|nr:carbamoyltransferase HypF [Acidimicrobiia bacterium]
MAKPAIRSAPPTARRLRIRVEGSVQGVGFRPFVHGLAHRLGLAGSVRNDTAGVLVEVEGAEHALDEFVRAVRAEAPPLAVVDSVTTAEIEPTGEPGFAIVASDAAGARQVAVVPDAATCDDCLAEIADPADRRYRYPFTNCTNCGPRFTITLDVPYDRPNTTMAGFEMCDACRAEYDDPSDRRFHAQPVCCAGCGPRLMLFDAEGEGFAEDPLAAAAGVLDDGGIVAVKGLGGYHLAVDACSETAVARLRGRKHRDEKPFAVMVPDVAAARQWCEMSDDEETLLTSPARPIVVMERRARTGGGASQRVASTVAPGNRSLGLMLPYTPLHHLLLEEFGGPLVMTSGNQSDEPIAYRDDDAFTRLAGIADAFLVHDRPIHIRTDDSVARRLGGRTVWLRRSRGLAPAPVRLATTAPRPVLGCGAELKHTFCLVRGADAFLSHHIGDLDHLEVFEAFTGGVEHFTRILGVDPAVVAHDLHPDYRSTAWAIESDLPLVGVQHHHAHVASCLADRGEEGPVIGVAFDGTGYGLDGTVWGGEILVADLARFERAAHLETVVMPGGTAAIREPWRMAAAWLDRLGLGDGGGLDVAARNAERWARLVEAARAGLNAPATSSVGRLFDAVAALAGVRDAVTYEGQAAVELEQRVDPGVEGAYEVRDAARPGGPGSPLVMPASDLVAAVVDDLQAGAGPIAVATRFHRGLADAVARTCAAVAGESGLTTVALSGGVFQNAFFTAELSGRLQREGLRVLTHSRVPPNDGGISLGQAAVAAARDAAGLVDR